MNHKTAYRLQGHLNFQGLEVAVENRKGSVRSGKDKDGKPWRTVMKAPYGYLVGTKGKDGEGIDCYVGPHKDAPVAFVVHQHREDGTGFDEDKIILGCLTEQEARELYLEHYDDPKFLGPIDAVLVEDLKLALRKRNQMNKVTPALVRQQLKTAGFFDFFRPSEEDIKAHEAAAAAHDAVLRRGGTGQEAAAAFDRVLAQHNKTAAMVDELNKLGFVTDEDAKRSLTVLEQLEQQRPRAREVARDAVVGGVLNPVTMSVARKIETGRWTKGHSAKEKALTVAADAFKGAVGSGALRLALQKSKETAHKGVLKEYVKEVDKSVHHKHAATSVDTLLERLRQRRPDLVGKLAFETSSYNGWGTQGAIRTKEDNPYYFGEVRKIPGPYAQPKTAAYTRYVGDGRHHDADEHEVGRKSHPMSAAAKALGLSTVGVIGGSLLYDLHDASRHGSSALSHAAAEALKKVAMEESQYSAGTDMGPLNARNNQYFPAPLHRPSPYARQKLADPVAERALAAFEKASMTSPAQRLARTQQVATHPGSLGRRGASINQIARTVGMPDPATTKSAL